MVLKKAILDLNEQNYYNIYKYWYSNVYTFSMVIIKVCHTVVLFLSTNILKYLTKQKQMRLLNLENE